MLILNNLSMKEFTAQSISSVKIAKILREDPWVSDYCWSIMIKTVLVKAVREYMTKNFF